MQTENNLAQGKIVHTEHGQKGRKMMRNFWINFRCHLLDNRGEWRRVRRENEEAPVLVDEIGGCQVELRFSSKADTGLEQRILTPLLDVLEETASEKAS